MTPPLRLWPVLGLVALALVLSACGSAPVVTPTPPAFAPVTGEIPGDAVFAVVARPLAMTQEDLDAELERLAASPGLHQAFRERLQVLLGVDVLDPAQLSTTGIDVRGDFAFFGVGVHPALLVRVADPQSFAAFIENVRVENPRVVFASQRMGELDVDTLQLGSLRISYVLFEQYLLAIYHDDTDDVGRLMAAARPSPEHGDMGHSDAFLEALKTMDGESVAVVAMANMPALDQALVQRARPRDSARYQLVPQGRREAWAASERERLNRCQARGAVVASHIPWVVGALIWEEGVVEQRLIVGMSAPLKSALAKVLQPVSAPFGAIAEGAAMAFALHLDFSALAALPTGDPTMVLCPNLAALEGAASLLVNGLGNTDAPYVFGGHMVGALYGFDLNLWLSERSAMLLFDALDVDAMMKGFELYFRGLGYGDNGTDDTGTHYFAAFNNLIGIGLVPLDAHVAIVLGKLDTDELMEELATSEPALPTFAQLEVDGTRLYDLLRGVTDSAGLSSLDAGFFESLVETFAGLESSDWTAAFEGNTLVLRAIWRDVPATAQSDEAPEAPDAEPVAVP